MGYLRALLADVVEMKYSLERHKTPMKYIANTPFLPTQNAFILMQHTKGYTVLYVVHVCIAAPICDEFKSPHAQLIM